MICALIEFYDLLHFSAARSHIVSIHARQIKCGSDDSLTQFTAGQFRAGFCQLRTCGSMDRFVRAAARDQFGIGWVYDGVTADFCDILSDDVDWHNFTCPCTLYDDFDKRIIPYYDLFFNSGCCCLMNYKNPLSKRRNALPFTHFCSFSSFLLFRLTRLICRSKSPLLISSVRTYCINVGTVQE